MFLEKNYPEIPKGGAGPFWKNTIVEQHFIEGFPKQMITLLSVSIWPLFCLSEADQMKVFCKVHWVVEFTSVRVILSLAAEMEKFIWNYFKGKNTYFQIVCFQLLSLRNSGKTDSTTGLWVQHGPTSKRNQQAKQAQVFWCFKNLVGNVFMRRSLSCLWYNNLEWNVF